MNGNEIRQQIAVALSGLAQKPLPDPMVLTTDADFKIYRRHSRQVVPCLLP